MPDSADYVAPRSLTVGSLFSGIGGIDLGLERAGMRVIWQSEIDKYASQVLAKHWPTVTNLGDVTKIDWSTIERPDVVAGGFPCQTVSAAGAKRAQADKRWLWPEFARCLQHVRPSIVIVENVPNLLGVAAGRAAQEVFGDLALLGFDAEWGVLPAAAFGAPHLRKRVFILAHARGERFAQRPECDRQPVSGLEASRRDDALGLRASVADAGLPGPEVQRLELDGHELPAAERGGPGGGRGALADPDEIGWRGGPGYLGSGRWPEPTDGGWWAVEPGVGRMVDGLPKRVDRLRCLGNAVVPQVAEYVGRLVTHIDGDD